jgi:hypothetical protein
METFAKDPDLLLSRAGLTEAEKETVRSADTEAIYRSLSSADEKQPWLFASMVPEAPPPQPPKPQEPPGPPPGPPPNPPKGQASAAAF